MSDMCQDRIGPGLPACGKPCLPKMTVCYDHVTKDALILYLRSREASIRPLRELWADHGARWTPHVPFDLSACIERAIRGW